MSSKDVQLQNDFIELTEIICDVELNTRITRIFLYLELPRCPIGHHQ